MTKIREVMTTDIDFCTLLDNVFEVAVKMKDINVGAIPILDGEKLVGIITDRDIVTRCIAEKHPASSKVESIMSKDIHTVDVDSTSEEAVKLMAKHQIRRLPVMEGDKLIGMVALGDLALHHLTDEQAEKALSEISENHYGGAQH